MGEAQTEAKTTTHYRPPRPTTHPERIELAQVLHDLQSSASKAVERLLENAPAANSRAAAEVALAQSLAETGYTEAFTGMAAATQHIEALGRILRNGDPLGAPVLGLARSVVESAGRAWFLLRPGEGSLDERAAALTLAELKYASSTMTFYRGDDHALVDIAAVRAELAVKRRNVDAPSFTGLAKTLMTDAGFSSVNETYSRLSGGAHGEATTVHGLRVNDPDHQSRYVAIGLPATDARVVVLLCVGATAHVMDALIAHFDHLGARERWESARDRVRLRCASLESRLNSDSAADAVG